MAELGTFSALDHRFALTVEGEASIDLGAILAPLAAPAAQPEVTYGLVFEGDDRGSLTADGVEVGSGRTRVVLQLLVEHFTRAAVAATAATSGPVLRGTAVRVGGSVVLLAGAAGQGASTLSARLLIDGASLVSDAFIAVEATSGHVRSFHRPIALTEKSFGLVGATVPAAAGRPCGCGGKVQAAPVHIGADVGDGGPPAVVALVDRDDDTLTPISAAPALAALVQRGIATLGDDDRDARTLAGMVAGSRCVRLGSRSLDDAADWVRQMVASAPTEPVPVYADRRGRRLDLYLGTQAVVFTRGEAHLLNESATAVWLLHNDGLRRKDIALELGLDVDMVDAAFAGFRQVETAG